MACICGQGSKTNAIKSLSNFKFTVFQFYICDCKDILKIGRLMYALTICWEKIRKST